MKQEESGTPFDRAQTNMMAFIVNMQTAASFDALASRIELLDTIMALPVMDTTSSLGLIGTTRESYTKEMEEIEVAVKLFCTLPGTPQA
jgi:hypothetical protein